MNEKRSIYEYLCENIDYCGKIAADCKIEHYMQNCNGEDYELNEELIYSGEDDEEDLFLQLDLDNNPVIGVDFRLGNIISKAISSLDFNELEKHLNEKEISINDILPIVVQNVEKGVVDADKEKLLQTVISCIKTTRNMTAMYVYLYIVSKLEIKNNTEEYKVILRIALMHEYCMFIDEHIIDNLEYPDYNRFYLAKRVRNDEDKIDLLFKVNLESNEMQNYLLNNVLTGNTTDNITKLFLKLDIMTLLTKKEMNESLYYKITKALYNVMGKIRKIYKYLDLKTILKEYTKYFEKYSDNEDIFVYVMVMYDWIANASDFTGFEIREHIYKEEENILKAALTTDKSKELLKKRYLDKKTKGLARSIMTQLSLTDNFLIIYNEFKADPLNNMNMLFSLEDENIIAEGLEVIYNTVDWDTIIGEFENKDEGSSETFDEYINFLSLFLHLEDYPEMAYKFYAKFLRAKVLKYRREAIYGLLKLKDVGYTYEVYSDELKESLEYFFAHEVNYDLKAHAEMFFGMRDIFDPVLWQDREKAKKFNLVGENVSETKVNTEDEEEENKNPKVINLKDTGLIWKLKGKDRDLGLDIMVAHRYLLFEELDDEIMFCIPGDEFGKEYTVRLKMDEKYNLKEAICTCGKCTKGKLCKHTAAAIIMVGKKNDQETKNNKNDEDTDE